MSGEPSRARILAPPALLAAVCVALGVAAQRLRPLPLLPESPALRIGLTFGLFAVAGILLHFSLRAFRRHRTTVNPYGSPTSLVTTGPFRISRNPLYVALLLVVLAFAPALDSAWLVLATALLFLLLDFGAVRPEERLLRARFGAEFEAFARRVRRWL